MRRVWILLVLIAWLTGRSSAAGQSVANPSESPTASSSTLAIASASAVLQKILDDWTARQSQVGCGEMTWEFAGRTRSCDYRASPPAIEDSQTPLARESVRVRFDRYRLRFDGTAEAAIQWGRYVLPDSQTWIASREFHTVLNSRLSDDTARHVPPPPYAVLIERDRETHSWSNQTQGVPCIVIFPVGTAGPLLFYDGSNAAGLPWMWGLIEPLRLALCPTFLFDAETLLEKAEVQEIRPQMAGRPCLAVDLPSKSLALKTSCRLVIDPSRDSLVVRATFRGEQELPLAQYDLDYDRDESGRWWPKAMTLVQFNGFGDPYDEQRAVRSELSSSAVSLSVEAPNTRLPGTWVLDQATVEQYTIDRDGTHRQVSLSEAVAKLSSSTGSSFRVAARPTLFSSIQQIAIKLVTWPWILATVGIIYGSSIRVWRRQRAC